MVNDNPSGTWKEDAPESKETEEKISYFASKAGRFGKRLFWAVAAVLLIVIAISGFYFLRYFETKDVALSLNAAGSALIGDPFDLDVGFVNNSDKFLEGARLVIELPARAAVLGESEDRRI